MKTERYKYPPVSTFDIKEIENWLEEMAAEGWFLKEAGSYAWFFEAGEPENVRYRIDPATEKKGKLNQEKRLDYEEMGWRYIATQQRFYHIFMSDDPETEELHTDAVVESFSARMLEKRLRNELFQDYGGAIILGAAEKVSGRLCHGDTKAAGWDGRFSYCDRNREDGTQVAAAMLDGRLLLAEYYGSVKLKDKILLIEEVLVSKRRRGF